MATTVTTPPGALYEVAAKHAADLAAGTQAAADQALAAWSQAYRQTRIDLDGLFSRMATAKAEGKAISPAWLYQQDRYKASLATAKTEMARYAQHASAVAIKAQQSSVLAAQAHAAKTMALSAQAGLPGLATGFHAVNPANLNNLVGFLADGSPVHTLMASLPAESGKALSDALIRGVALGHGVDRMLADANTALNIPRWRAETIIRTEALRSYRETTRQTFMANAAVLGGWTWHAALDARTCAACAVMDGTEHPVDATLDGHPRCRCAMVPRTKTWDEITGQTTGLPDTRPPVRSGKDWLAAQPDAIQRHVMGRGKHLAYQQGKIGLDDLVARPNSASYGTMRRERSLREIEQGLHPNYADQVAAPPLPPAPVRATLSKVLALAEDDTQSLSALKAAGKAGDVNAEAAARYRAASKDWAPPLHQPDVVDKAVGKMNAALETKGYPSKGYSQTKAIYKSQANGEVGKKVGVKNPLTWQDKVNASRALTEHDAYLQTWVEQAAAKAESEALAAANNAKALETLAADKATAAKVVDDLKVALGDSTGGQGAGAALDDAQAALYDLQSHGADKTITDGLKARVQALDDQLTEASDQAKVHGTTSKMWESSSTDASMEIGPDGWGEISYGSGATQTVTPGQVNKIIDVGDWAPEVLKPKQYQVTQIVKDLTAADGTLDEVGLAFMEDGLDAGVFTGQNLANIKEAVKQAKVVLDVKVNPVDVAKVVKQLDHGITTLAEIEKDLAEIPMSNGAKAVLNQAMTEYKAQAAVESAVTPEVAQAAVAATQGGQPFLVANLEDTGKVLGTHGARVLVDKTTGQRWLWKPPVNPYDGFLSTLDEAASKIQASTGLTTPDTYVTTIGGRRGSIQRMFDSTDAFPTGLKPSTLTAADRLAVQQQQVVDWLLSNHDGHHGQFLRTPDGRMVGIDKGQSFRWFGQDRLDWDFHPNAHYGTPEPVYNTLWRDFAKGGAKDALNPAEGELGAFIKKVQGLSDDELRATLRPYAEQAKERGLLVKPQPSFPGVTPATVPTNDVEAFLDAVIQRKKDLAKDFQALYDKAATERRKNLPDWKPSKPKATKAKTVKSGATKWKDAPAPVPPLPPVPVAVARQEVFADWLKEAEARFAANPNKAKATLQESANWARFQKVIDNGDRTALQELLDRKYLDQAMHDRGLALIDKAQKVQEAAAAEAAKAQRAYAAAMKRHAKDVTDWREANGITSTSRGMDTGLRHETDGAGVRHHDSAYDAMVYTGQIRSDLSNYTGSFSSTWNNHLRETGGVPTRYEASLKRMDAAMKLQPVREDTILHRGTAMNAFRD